MRIRALLRAMFLGPLLLLNGCQLFFLGVVNAHHMTLERATTPREMKQIAVVDVRTNAPVAGARVRLVYNFDWLDDWEEDLVTNAGGIANVKVAMSSTHVLHVSVRAAGYRPQHRASLSGFDSQHQVDVLLTREADAGPAEIR